MNLVTGASGLVGSHLMMNLLTQNKKVRALYRSEKSIQQAKKIFSYYGKQELLDQVEWVLGEMNDLVSLEQAVEGVDYVYHCAALVSFKKNDRDLLFKINVEGTKNIINVALVKGVKKFCHVSSTAAVGKAKNQEYYVESNSWKGDKQTSNYSWSKHLSEMEVWRGIEEGLNAVIVNPCIILGPGDWNQGSAELFTKVYQGLNYYTKGINAFVDVRDVASCMEKLMESNISAERFLLVSENWVYQDLFNQMAGALNKPRPQHEVKPWMLGLAWTIEAVRSFFTRKAPLVTKETASTSMAIRCYSNEKVKQALQMNFISVSQSIQDTAQFFLQDRANN